MSARARLIYIGHELELSIKILARLAKLKSLCELAEPSALLSTWLVKSLSTIYGLVLPHHPRQVAAATYD
jgi:hypothetical protein